MAVSRLTKDERKRKQREQRRRQKRAESRRKSKKRKSKKFGDVEKKALLRLQSQAQALRAKGRSWVLSLDDADARRTRQVKTLKKRERARQDAEEDAAAEEDSDIVLDSGLSLMEREHKRQWKAEVKLARLEGRELTKTEKANVFKRVTDALNSRMGQFQMELQDYITTFDRTSMSRDDIQELRKVLRKEFMTNMYDNMTEKEIDAFKQARQRYKYAIASKELQQEYDARDVERNARDNLRVLERLQRIARKTEKAKEDGIEMKERPMSFRDMSPLRSAVSRNIVEPRFHTPRHLDTIVRELHMQNPATVTVSMMAQATRMTSTTPPTTGRTFFPPQNANPTIVYPWKAVFAPPSRPLPTYMNWADTGNVAAVRGWDVPRKSHLRSRVATDKQGWYTHEVVDQLGCGSCWVISVASAMSDRASIWSQESNPQLSITNILGCVSGDGKEGPTVAGASMYSPATAGCAGGLPMGAVEMLAAFGDASSTCVGYEWCENDPVCNASKRLGFSDAPAYLNSIMPACADMLHECTSSSQPRTAWGLKTYPSGRPYIMLTDIQSIQQEIAAHGPVVATHAIFADFQNGTVAIVGDGWAKTHGVYCNVQTAGAPRPYNGTRYAGSERQLIGYHAVVIVGWGVERDVPDWGNPGSTLDIPYWIVRNSWSTGWNPECNVNGINMPGHCKIAFTDPSRNINTKVYLDNAEDGMLGAAIAFMPRVTRIDPVRIGESQVDEEPEMHEEKIESVVDDTDVTLAAFTGVGDPPPDDDSDDDSDVLCDAKTTPFTSYMVNCEGRQASTTRLNASSTTRLNASTSSSCILILLLLTIIIVVATILLILRQRKIRMSN